MSERGIAGQSSNTLRRGIRSYEKLIAVHEKKITSPHLFYDEWDCLSELEKRGCIRHWKKEILTAENSIKDRIDELKRRGEEP